MQSTRHAAYNACGQQANAHAHSYAGASMWVGCFHSVEFPICVQNGNKHNGIALLGFRSLQPRGTQCLPPRGLGTINRVNVGLPPTVIQTTKIAPITNVTQGAVKRLLS